MKPASSFDFIMNQCNQYLSKTTAEEIIPPNEKNKVYTTYEILTLTNSIQGVINLLDDLKLILSSNYPLTAPNIDNIQTITYLEKIHSLTNKLMLLFLSTTYEEHMLHPILNNNFDIILQYCRQLINTKDENIRVHAATLFEKALTTIIISNVFLSESSLINTLHTTTQLSNTKNYNLLVFYSNIITLHHREIYPSIKIDSTEKIANNFNFHFSTLGKQPINNPDQLFATAPFFKILSEALIKQIPNTLPKLNQTLFLEAIEHRHQSINQIEFIKDPISKALTL